MYVRVKHVKVSAVKNKYYIKNTAAAGVGFNLIYSTQLNSGWSPQHGHHSNPGHQISNTQRTENKTTDVVIQQDNRKLLMMDILMSETRWVYKKWNKIASDTKLVFYFSRFMTFDS